MKIDIKLTGDNSRMDGLQSHIKRRIDPVLGRFADRIAQIDVQIADIKDSIGAIQKQCLVRVRLLASAISITQETHGADPFAAIDRAIEGMARSFSRLEGSMPGPRRATTDLTAA